MELSVITVNTNDREKILVQIQSVCAGTGDLTCEQIIADNGSTDGSVAEIRRRFPDIKIVENGSNIGFGAANNAAVKISQGDLLLFLNPDMRVAPDSLKIIVDWMKSRPEVGIASCRLTDENGKFEESTKPRRFPTVWDQAAIILKIPHLFPVVLRRYLYAGFNPDLEQEVDSVRGSFMLMRRELTRKLGWAFDPRYFIWFEDVDICREAKRLGFKVMYTPVTSCVDYISQSFKRLPALQKQIWFTNSMISYFKKWEPRWQAGLLAGLRPIGLFISWLSGILARF